MPNAIHELENQLLTAMRTHDVDTLDRLLADDLLFTDHLGRHWTKADDLAEHRSGRMTIDRLEPSEQVFREAPNTVVVSVRLHIEGTYAQDPFVGDLRFTRFWVLRGGSWQVLAAHSCVVAPGGA